MRKRCRYWVEMVPEMQPYLAYGSFSARFRKRDKPKKQSAEKAMLQRMYIQLKNSRLTAYRMGIRVKSTVYGSALPIASMTAVLRTSERHFFNVGHIRPTKR